MTDKSFLIWLYERLLYVHKENPYVDYMHKLRAIIRAYPIHTTTPNIVQTEESIKEFSNVENIS